jgi:WD repeat-containing protein 22
LYHLFLGKIVDIFPHDEPVYCVACHPENPDLFATACADGRVMIYDLRTAQEDPLCLSGSVDSSITDFFYR